MVGKSNSIHFISTIILFEELIQGECTMFKIAWNMILLLYGLTVLLEYIDYVFVFGAT